MDWNSFLFFGFCILSFCCGLIVGLPWGLFAGRKATCKTLNFEREVLAEGGLEEIIKRVNESPEFKAVVKRMNEEMSKDVDAFIEQQKKERKW
jgi:hypothetical protein